MSKLKTVDPFKMASASSTREKKDQLAEVSITSSLREHLKKFTIFTERKKNDDAEAQTARAEVLTWAKQEFVKRIMQGLRGNFMITNGENLAHFIVQAKGRVFGQVETKALTESYGEGAANLLTPNEDVHLNLDIWNLHQQKLIAALNATDEDGKPLVEEEILASLFYRTLKVKDSVINDAVALAKGDEAKLTALLFDDQQALRLTCSLSAK